ncbi:hypothetical protein [Nocardioides convexus]|uniref:hypothetical protein n=1 Tax=Nocardioides convexus TaxID=2712224 RepID=UPI0024185D01|nr:hypothetical protein [Nocardioides convexus]
MIKVVADLDRGVLVGATAVGPAGGEIIGMLVTAIHGEVPVATLRGMHFAYPTFHRAIETALDDLSPIGSGARAARRRSHHAQPAITTTTSRAPAISSMT